MELCYLLFSSRAAPGGESKQTFYCNMQTMRDRATQATLSPWLCRLAVAAFNCFLLAGVARPAEAPDSQAIPGRDSVVITPDYVAGLSEQMRTANPALKAMEARTNAAVAGLRSVRTWEDPRVRVGGMLGSEMMRADDGDILYGADQTLPLFGRPRAARAVARAALEVETAGLDFRFQELRAELAKTLFRAALADEILNTAREDLGWLESIAGLTENRLQSGRAGLLEVLTSRNDLAEVRTQVETDRDELRHWHVALNRILNTNLQSSWPRLRLPEPGPHVEFNSNLIAMALKFEPRTLVMKEEIKLGEAAVSETRRKLFPEVMAGVESRNYSGNGEFRQGMVFLGMSVPWFNASKYRSEIRRDAQKVRQMEFELADYELALQEEIHDLTVKANAFRRRALLYRDEIVPRTRSALESTRAMWESGKASYDELLSTRRVLLDAQLKYHRSVADQYVALSELVLCCGLGDLGALDMLSEAAATGAPMKPAR
jgi:outer membrane protein, heavy metal efflux system